jgi:biotin carboxyl carrier protein
MKYQVTINKKIYEVEVERGIAQVVSEFEASQDSPVVTATVSATAPIPTPSVIESLVPAQVHVVAGEALTAPMPGTILSVLKKAGDTVAEGETVLILEAMKMENEVVAAAAGIVSQVLVNKGSVVKTGDPLVMIR